MVLNRGGTNARQNFNLDSNQNLHLPLHAWLSRETKAVSDRPCALNKYAVSLVEQQAAERGKRDNVVGWAARTGTRNKLLKSQEGERRKEGEAIPWHELHTAPVPWAERRSPRLNQILWFDWIFHMKCLRVGVHVCKSGTGCTLALISVASKISLHKLNEGDG